MKCPKCGTEFDSNFCPNCATPYHESQQRKQKRPACQQNPPAKQSVTVKKSITTLNIIAITLAGCLVFAIFAIAFSWLYSAAEKHKTPDLIISNLNSSVQEIGLDPEQVDIESYDKETNKLIFTDSEEQYEDSFLVEFDANDTVQTITYAGINLIKDGKVTGNVNNNLISHDEKVTIITLSKNAVENILKSPSSAEYQKLNEWNILRDQSNYVIVVKSWVDSENSFGVSVRSNFEIHFEPDEDIFKMKSFVFDGEKIL